MGGKRWLRTARMAAFDLAAAAPPEAWRQGQNRHILAAWAFLVALELLLGALGGAPALTAADAVRVLGAVSGTGLLLFLAGPALGLSAPPEVLVIQGLLLAVFLLALRIAGQLAGLCAARLRVRGGGARPQRVLIYGAGEAGRYLAGRLAARPQEGLRVVGFVDDDPGLRGARVGGRRVLGASEELPALLEAARADQLIVAMERLPKRRMPGVLAACRAAGCRARRFGSLEELEANRLESAAISDLRLEDLLRRDSVRLDGAAVKELIGGRRVLVTGGAGSIGSELCRQVLALGARLLVVFDIHENGLYELDNELRERFGPARYRLCLGSVRDRKRLDEVMREHRPELVFHAAAHKHVPMMELNPREAVKNNVFGTLRTAQAAIGAGVRRFILISTDKAVNPANIMGATKRIAEMSIQMLTSEGDTRFSAVRFGNVLGSHGSVVPHFQEQIGRGGPVTVTHPEMRRYFMTIPEAVQLVLEAGAMAKGGEIFVLDMGEPVRIADLAADMIRLSGLEPGRDIEIVFTGPRPGEKLFEEIRLADEDTLKTENDKIYVNKPIPAEHDLLKCRIGALSLALDGDLDGMFAAVEALVPTFRRGGGP